MARRCHVRRHERSRTEYLQVPAHDVLERWHGDRCAPLLELVGEGGLPFIEKEELPELLERLVDEIEERRAAITVPALEDVVSRYLEVLRS